MEIKIHQVYFDDSQVSELESFFIPYRNIPNMESPYAEYHEYPILKQLHSQYTAQNYSGYWGYTSWRFREKIKQLGITPFDYYAWLLENPGYDFYHMNVEQSLNTDYLNIFVQGEFHHRGLYHFFDRLIKLNNWDFDLTKRYTNDYNITCHYYVMNNQTWTQWLEFQDNVLQFITKDEELHNFANGLTTHRGRWHHAWAFIAERLITIWVHLNPQVKFLAYR